jgi:uncharacterized protein (TIGR02271 family)
MAAANRRSTLVGVFEDPYQADKAVNELLNSGFRQDQIGVAMRTTEGMSESSTTPDADTADSDGSYAGSGAVTGAITGLGLGALAGLGVLAGVVPVIGPAIAAGTMGVILSNAAAGAGIVGLVGALVGAGMPEHEAQYYHEEFEAGRTIVTVAADGRADEATAILQRYGAYDMKSRGSSAAKTQSSTWDTEESVRAGKSGVTGREGDTIQVKEERLRARTQPVETGEVTVRKEIHTENKTLEVPVQREEVVIERTPVHGRAATDSITADDIREGEQIRIPVREDRVNVSKEAVVTEEVKVGKRTVQDTERVSGQVRKEELKVDKTGDADVKTRGGGKGSNPA